MIRTLIVDDEHLVRKGLIYTVPWKECGFEIVAEADNGESALEIMEQMPIDLLMTDLTMPVMNGFDLMKTVKERFPSIRMVVLTCHQDFHFLQDAVRLGAIDYVVKTDIADNVLEEMLHRIQGRIESESEQRVGQAVADEEAEKAAHRQALVIMRPMRSTQQVHQALLEGAVQVQESVWLLANKTSAEVDELLTRVREVGQVDVLCFIRVTDWSEKTRASEWVPALRDWYFYTLHMGSGEDWNVQQGELLAAAAARLVGAADIPVDFRSSWLKLRWLFDKKEFDELMQRIREMELPSEKVLAMFEGMAAAWELLSVTNQLWTDWREATAGFATLAQWQNWFEHCCIRMAQYARSRGCSNDVFIAIIRALEMLHADSGESANRTELSAKVNLSQSYFSTVFKEIVGKSFHEALKEARLEKAKQMLTQYADMPIYWIAEKTGFQDEKYFSKIFRVQTGMVPSEYREKQLQSGLR
ncbi:response regulator [Paenibacillus sp. OV219]|uniref:response regulator n=1 Tax=Paenibacillus sp. OV219 TaxID=1884377 RepID=UPI0008C3A4A6|nr:response regulator [Paenibacillus sp. OV219]SEM58751.1 two-component system, response regulator YesN [Paenibacillus sp. OV219]